MGKELHAVLLYNRKRELLDFLFGDELGFDDQDFLTYINSTITLVLNKIADKFKEGSFGMGTYDTDDFRYIFCEAGPDNILISILDSTTIVENTLAYVYIVAEKVARIFDGRPVSPVIPKLDFTKNEEVVQRKLDVLQRIQFHSSDYVYKLILGGDGAVGKTSMIHRYIEGFFKTDYKATIGTYISKKECKFDNLGSTVRFVIWDLAGQEQFKQMRHIYLPNSEAGIIVYDITRRDTFENVMEWYQDFKKYAPVDIIIILVGNKTDLEAARQVSTQEGKKLADDLGLHFIETSAKSGENVDESFEIIALQIIKRFVEAVEVYKLITKRIPENVEVDQKQSILRAGGMEEIEKISLDFACKEENVTCEEWLEKNLHYLNDTLNLSLSPVETWKNDLHTPRYIITMDKYGNRVLIVPILGRGEEFNLNALITALASQEAKIAILISEVENSNLEKAIIWLNNNTREDVFLYYLMLEIFKIPNFAPLLKFSKISGPPMGLKRIKKFQEPLSEKEKLRVDFWNYLVEKLKKMYPEHSNIEILKNSWIFKPTGKDGLYYAYIIQDDFYAVEIYFGNINPEINNKRFEELKSFKKNIEERFSEISWHLSEELEWNFEKNRNFQSIRYRFRDAGLSNKKKWNEIQFNLIDTMKCLVSSSEPYIKKLSI